MGKLNINPTPLSKTELAVLKTLNKYAKMFSKEIVEIYNLNVEYQDLQPGKMYKTYGINANKNWQKSTS